MSKEEASFGYAYHLPTRGIAFRLRNALAQFSDLFSEFNKYIAPAYHHDRCERSVQMRIYGMHKREFVLVFLGIFALFGLATFIGLAGPPITVTTEQKTSNLLRKSNETDISRGPFVMRSPAMGTYNQQLWIMGKILTDNVEGSREDMLEGRRRRTLIFSVVFTLFYGLELRIRFRDVATISVMNVLSYDDPEWVASEKKGSHRLAVPEVVTDEIFDKTFHVSVEVDGISSEHKPVRLWKENELRNRTRHIRCKQSTCDEFRILHLGYLDYTHYVLTVRFYGLESFHKRYHIKEIIVYFKTYNPAFTQLEIWFRFIFLLSSFVGTLWFGHTLRKYPTQDWSIEQKWMSILLPLLLLYNDPIFPLTFLVNNSFPGILDAIFQESFFAAILMFWLCGYHGLRQNERRFLTFYVPKLILVLSMWLLSLIFAVNQRYYEWSDPTYSYQIHTDQFYDYKVAYAVMGSLYGIYLACLILRAYSELRSMPYFDVRLKLLTSMMVIIVAFVFSLFSLKFGIGVVEDNFASELTTNYKSSAEFMALYGILNFSFYAMAYLYSPSSSLPFESQITKDNPAFSMVNDSDEDVLYGSDEEIRQPLNRSCNNDDSD